MHSSPWALQPRRPGFRKETWRRSSGRFFGRSGSFRDRLARTNRRMPGIAPAATPCSRSGRDNWRTSCSCRGKLARRWQPFVASPGKSRCGRTRSKSRRQTRPWFGPIGGLASKGRSTPPPSRRTAGCGESSTATTRGSRRGLARLLGRGRFGLPEHPPRKPSNGPRSRHCEPRARRPVRGAFRCWTWRPGSGSFP